jgi:hypothetical protein
MACHIHGFSRDAQLQATVNTSCWRKALHDVMEITNGSYVRPLARTLCYKEAPNAIARQLKNLCYISNKISKVSLEFPLQY